MCILIRDGSNARIMCSTLIFRNKSSNYPIKWLQDNVGGVAYRSSPTQFINNAIMQQWLGEVRCWGSGGTLLALARSGWITQVVAVVMT